MRRTRLARGLAVVAVWVHGVGCGGRGAEAPRCRPPVEAAAEWPVAFERMFGDLTFPKPVQLLPFPPLPGAWIVVQHAGIAEIVERGSRRTYFDISERVRVGQQWGLQELAFHPRFPVDPRIFLAYVAADNLSIVSSLRASTDGSRVDVGTEEVLLRESQEQPWHPVASLEFGPDGYLYVAWGEGGQNKKSQAPEYLGGKMLRIDVDRRDPGRGYAIPPDNPFLETAFRPETFAIGLRNPWRFSFDRESGELWLGDVGARQFEEIDRIVAGGNYGYPGWEGSACIRPEGCGDAEVIPPVVQHSHNEMCSVTGGYVYRGAAIPTLRGRYVYADFCSGTIWALGRDDDGAIVTEPVARAPRYVAAFAEDPEGELYLIESHDTPDDHQRVESGFMAYRLVPNRKAGGEGASVSAGQTLAESRCIGPDGYRAEPPGMVAYEINLPAWAEGAETVRFMSSGAGAAIYGEQDALERPRNSVVMKTFAADGRPVETQVLVNLPDGRWVGLDYEWDDDGRDARLLTGGKTKLLDDGTSWTFPGPEGCGRCHHTQVGSLRALKLSQLAGDFAGRDQLAWLEERGALTWRTDTERMVPPALPRLDDESAPLEQRARAYLDVNCSPCHQPGGDAGEATMDLRWTTPFSASRVCGRRPNAMFPGHEDAALLRPGDPARSLISIRMHRNDSAAMPPQRRAVDPLGVRIVDAWIARLSDCPPGDLARFGERP